MVDSFSFFLGGGGRGFNIYVKLVYMFFTPVIVIFLGGSCSYLFIYFTFSLNEFLSLLNLSFFIYLNLLLLRVYSGRFMGQKFMFMFIFLFFLFSFFLYI